MPAFMPTTPDLPEDPRFHLSIEMLRGGAVLLTAWGTSMLPSLWPGDLLTIEPAEHHEIAPGDIVLVLRKNRFFIHRVVERPERSGSFWITKGDSMPQSDPPATAFDLLGKVVRVCRGNRIFAPSRNVPMSRSAVAWILCRSKRIRSFALCIHAASLQEGSPRTAYFDRCDSGAMSGRDVLSGSRTSHV